MRKPILTKKQVRKVVLDYIKAFNESDDDSTKTKALDMLIRWTNYSWTEHRLYYRINQYLDQSGNDKIKLVGILPVVKRSETLTEQHERELTDENNHTDNQACQDEMHCVQHTDKAE